MDTSRITSSLGFVAGMHVAELGCGSGFFVIAASRMVGSEGIVTAVDIRQDPLDEVRSKADALGLGNIRTVRADLEVAGATGIPDNSQDFSVLANVLFQSQKKQAIVTEAARVAKPGGRVVIINWKKGAGGLGPPDELRSGDDELKQLAEHAGLKFERALDTGPYHVGFIFLKP